MKKIITSNIFLCVVFLLHKMGEFANFSRMEVDVLDDLCSRFIINVPTEEQTDLVRVCFQIELAHWFYIDFYCTEERKKCGMKEFTWNIFNHLPFLRCHVNNVQAVLDSFREYKMAVPTYGAIILDEDLTHVLLVQGFYAKSSWGFPKGKVNETESPMYCAIREVKEETGFDITPLADENEFVESNINDQNVRLYLVPGVPRNTKFTPVTRCEIRAVEWFPIADLPCNKKDVTSKLKFGLGPNNFFMVMPFMKRIKRWVADRLQKDLQQNLPGRRSRIKSQSDSDGNKGKKQQQQLNPFAQALQAEVMEYQQFKAKQSLTPGQNGQSRRRTENVNGRAKQSSAKRQIFKNTGDDEKTNSKKVGNQNSNVHIQYDKNGIPIITAPSWVHFKFDRQALIKQYCV
ncbi:hypothetical protein B566_EDAN011406 [Ephemera danica]|nr:hypothetical protein B566_EDAN011406 [Ephemera danica]